MSNESTVRQDKGDESQWETRQGMLSEEDVQRLSAEKGQAELGACRADQTSQPGPNADNPVLEGGRCGENPREPQTNQEPRPDDGT